MCNENTYGSGSIQFMFGGHFLKLSMHRPCIDTSTSEVFFVYTYAVHCTDAPILINDASVCATRTKHTDSCAFFFYSSPVCLINLFIFLFETNAIEGNQ